MTANFRSNSAQRIAFCLVAAGSAALIVRALVAEPQTVDDLFIFLRYARNLAQRGEYVRFSRSSGYASEERCNHFTECSPISFGGAAIR